jgi:hypothetical protein
MYLWFQHCFYLYVHVVVPVCVFYFVIEAGKPGARLMGPTRPQPGPMTVVLMSPSRQTNRLDRPLVLSGYNWTTVAMIRLTRRSDGFQKLMMIFSPTSTLSLIRYSLLAILFLMYVFVRCPVKFDNKTSPNCLCHVQQSVNSVHIYVRKKLTIICRFWLLSIL